MKKKFLLACSLMFSLTTFASSKCDLDVRQVIKRTNDHIANIFINELIDKGYNPVLEKASLSLEKEDEFLGTAYFSPYQLTCQHVGKFKAVFTVFDHNKQITKVVNGKITKAPAPIDQVKGPSFNRGYGACSANKNSSESIDKDLKALSKLKECKN